MKTIGCYEAKTHLPDLLKQVAEGQRITITRHGVPVAVLIPPGPRRGAVSDAIRNLRSFRQGRRLRGLSIRKMIDEGRRY